MRRRTPTVSVIAIAILAAVGYTVVNESHGYYRIDPSSYLYRRGRRLRGTATVPL